MTVTRFATRLWFDRETLDAARLHTSLLSDSRIERVVDAPLATA